MGHAHAHTCIFSTPSAFIIPSSQPDLYFSFLCSTSNQQFEGTLSRKLLPVDFPAGKSDVELVAQGMKLTCSSVKLSFVPLSQKYF